MNKKEKETLANAVKERREKGLEFISSFPMESLFDEVKKIVRKHIPEDAKPYLDSCKFYRLDINDNKVRIMYFSFGGILNGYDVTIDADMLKIGSRNPDFVQRLLYRCPTCSLIKE